MKQKGEKLKKSMLCSAIMRKREVDGVRSSFSLPDGVLSQLIVAGIG
jgi:hypothetical protein